MEVVELIGYTLQWLNMRSVLHVRAVNKVHKDSAQYYTTPSFIKVFVNVSWFTQTFPLLTKITTKDLKNMTDQDFECMSKIQHLNMNYSNIKFITDHCFKPTSLKELHLKGCYQYRHHFTDEMFSYVSGLKVFSIDDNHVITNKGLKQLIHLEDLYISNCSNISNEGFQCPNLIKLWLYNVGITDDVFGQLPNLQNLNLTFGQITSHGICKLKKLKRLDLICNIPSLQGLETLPNLTSVSISCCAMLDENVTYLANVEYVSLYECCNITGKYLNHLHRLKQLSIHHLPIEIVHLIPLQFIKPLPLISIYNCKFNADCKITMHNIFGKNFKTD
jgi:Leucine-rich repeat (LRR) protein